MIYIELSVFCFYVNSKLLQAKAEAIKLEEQKIKEDMKEFLEAEREKQILEAKKKQKEELVDKAPIIEMDMEQVMIDPAPVIAIDVPKQKEKSEEGLSGKDLEVIEDALEKLGKFIVFGFTTQKIFCYL